MNLTLGDILDLEYLIRLDDDDQSPEAMPMQKKRDRTIFQQMDKESGDKKQLLKWWLAVRRKQIAAQTGNPGGLPGQLHEKSWAIMKYVMVMAGFLAGLSLAGSFLAYHGSRPVNVTFFVFLFILLPAVLSILTAGMGVFRLLIGRRLLRLSPVTVFNALLRVLMFKWVPGLLKRWDWEFAVKGMDTAEYARFILNKRADGFKSIFFWLFFILTSLFAIGFSIGTLAITLFRVMVSDLAFGWQSTILSSSRTVYELVEKMAWPWTGLISKAMAHPDIEQINGSRIVLKEGISVLATQDLVSWWPFLCMGIVCYALIPRLILAVLGSFSKQRAIHRFEFNRPQYNELIARMTTPLVSVETARQKDGPAGNDIPVRQTDGDSGKDRIDPDSNPAVNSVLLVDRAIYHEKLEQELVHGIENQLFFRVKKIFDISQDIEQDKKMLEAVDPIEIQQVILAQEAWQPPIRGLLYYIDQMANTLPGNIPLFVLLTNDAGQENLAVEADDPDVDIWRKALVSLDHPMIKTKRFV